MSIQTARNSTDLRSWRSWETGSSSRTNRPLKTKEKPACQGSNFITKADPVIKLRDRWMIWKRIVNIEYTPVGQQDRASHHFHELPKE